jgi:hypothetical protein
MSRNPLLEYQNILVETDTNAREEYDFDPRVEFARQSLVGEPEQEYEQETQHKPAAADAPFLLEEGEEAHFSGGIGDKKALQAPPKHVEKKVLVILDTGHRDWIRQYNAYSCTFAFGTPNNNADKLIEKFPIFENNKTIPTIAYENSNKILNQPNIAGFTISGRREDRGVHLDFKPYNPFSGPGRLVGYDLYSKAVQSNFSTSNAISNVTSVRLARATLPHRRFFNFNPALFPSYTKAGVGVQNMLTSFSTEPYLLLNVNKFQGQYLGGNDPVSRAFSVLAQDRRTVLDPAATIGVQFQDYYPWSTEEFMFSSPLAALPNFEITLTDSTGNVYSQIDDIMITKIEYAGSIGSSNSSGGSNMLNTAGAARLLCTMTRQTAPPSVTSAYNINELRPGDRIRFHNAVLRQHLLRAKTQTGSNILGYFLSNDAVILANTVDVNTNISQVFFDTQFIIAYDPFTFYGDTPASAVIEQNEFTDLSSLAIPIMNINMQATFAFEIKTLVPDTSTLSSVPAR